MTLNRYARIIERIFLNHHEAGLSKVEFEREEIVSVAATLQIALPKNLGDVLYSFRYRTELPASIREKAPADHEWIIRSHDGDDATLFVGLGIVHLHGRTEAYFQGDPPRTSGNTEDRTHLSFLPCQTTRCLNVEAR